MADRVRDLLNLEIDWWSPPGTVTEFRTLVEGAEATLVMNDFPEEVMYTLSWKGQSISFDDKPLCWTLPPIE